MLFSLVFVAFLQYCAAKPVKYTGYPEENRNVNNPLLFEGDMLISNYQKQIALAGEDVAMATGRKRGATTWGTWPNGKIPYTIDSAVSDQHVQAIKSAMGEWESKTCIQFVDRTTNDNYYIKIVPGNSCSAIVGYQPIPGGLDLTLGNKCYDESTLLHELGHVIGFWHEQSRPDRDNYVTILHQNIKLGEEGNFRQYTNSRVDSLGLPYDIKSIMHYGPRAFSKDSANLDTIQLASNQVGQLVKNVKLSAGDITQTNLLYNCQGV